MGSRSRKRAKRARLSRDQRGAAYPADGNVWAVQGLLPWQSPKGGSGAPDQPSYAGTADLHAALHRVDVRRAVITEAGGNTILKDSYTAADILVLESQARAVFQSYRAAQPRPCIDCDQPRWPIDLYNLELPTGMLTDLCRPCMSKHAVSCEHCGKLTDRDLMHTRPQTGQVYCQECIDRCLVKCRYCATTETNSWPGATYPSFTWDSRVRDYVCALHLGYCDSCEGFGHAPVYDHAGDFAGCTDCTESTLCSECNNLRSRSDTRFFDYVTVDRTFLQHCAPCREDMVACSEDGCINAEPGPSHSEDTDAPYCRRHIRSCVRCERYLATPFNVSGMCRYCVNYLSEAEGETNVITDLYSLEYLNDLGCFQDDEGPSEVAVDPEYEDELRDDEVPATYLELLKKSPTLTNISGGGNGDITVDGGYITITDSTTANITFQFYSDSTAYTQPTTQYLQEWPAAVPAHEEEAGSDDE
jgi:hypothetical protein